MACQEHQELATFIKSVHQSLRNRTKEIGVEKAWNEHCIQYDILQKYAEAMRTLASKYWEENAREKAKGAKSRVQWVMEKCFQYFMKDREEEDKREEKALTKLNLHESCITAGENQNIPTVVEVNQAMPDINLLDVGSCYNPFGIYPFFNVLPIDLAPATPDVYQCDFLDVDVKSKDSFRRTECGNCITQLEFESFDVVVFSLLLEYMPSPAQRYSCVTKAYSVLKPGGLLFIITPDSKHSTANSPLMKSWRIVLADLGFLRVYYEKLPHIHCMAYRKCKISQVAKHWSLKARKKQGKQSFMALHNMSAQGLYIPQDLQENYMKCDVTQASVERTALENEELVEMFHYLPEDCT